MKSPITVLVTVLAASALAGCMGAEGNPGGQPYADAPSGVIAVRPEPAPAVTYDATATQPAFDDMRIGQPALIQSPRRSMGRRRARFRFTSFRFKWAPARRRG